MGRKHLPDPNTPQPKQRAFRARNNSLLNIYIPNQSKQTLGGGFIFIDNFEKGMKGRGQLVGRWQDCDAVLIVSVTMTDRSDIAAAKAAGKKIILRIDNMPKDSRNRGTAFSRMKDYGQQADVIVFQSEWAKQYVGSWLEFNHKVDLSNSHVIYNGVDTDYFYHKDNPAGRSETYLFTTFNTDENKRFPEAAYDFHLRDFTALYKGTTRPHLMLVGNIPGSWEYKFDFFNGERVSYQPPVSDRRHMGDIYRSCRYLYFPAFADASPNTVGEAMACGCEVLLAHEIGGTKEVIEQYNKRIITIQENANKILDLIKP